jgi:hypothetical protein
MKKLECMVLRKVTKDEKPKIKTAMRAAVEDQGNKLAAKAPDYLLVGTTYHWM